MYTVTVHLDLRQHFDKDQLFGGLIQNSMAGSASEQKGDDKSKGPSLKGAGQDSGIRHILGSSGTAEEGHRKARK